VSRELSPDESGEVSREESSEESSEECGQECDEETAHWQKFLYFFIMSGDFLPLSKNPVI
jgi:hypothetical protein